MGNFAPNNPGFATHEVRAFMETRGFICCDKMREVRAAHALGVKLIPGVALATPQTIMAVQDRTQSSVFLRRGQSGATGFMAFMTLSREGERAAEAGFLDGTRLRPEWAAPPSPESRLGYIWAFGGAVRSASFAIVRTWRLMRAAVFPHLGVYARAATPHGHALMAPLGYRALGDHRAGWFYSPPASLATATGTP